MGRILIIYCEFQTKSQFAKSLQQAGADRFESLQTMGFPTPPDTPTNHRAAASHVTNQHWDTYHVTCGHASRGSAAVQWAGRLGVFHSCSKSGIADASEGRRVGALWSKQESAPSMGGAVLAASMGGAVCQESRDIRNISLQQRGGKSRIGTFWYGHYLGNLSFFPKKFKKVKIAHTLI